MGNDIIWILVVSVIVFVIYKVAGRNIKLREKTKPLKEKGLDQPIESIAQVAEANHLMTMCSMILCCKILQDSITRNGLEYTLEKVYTVASSISVSGGLDRDVSDDLLFDIVDFSKKNKSTIVIGKKPK